jgi:hypothetical protein
VAGDGAGAGAAIPSKAAAHVEALVGLREKRPARGRIAPLPRQIIEPVSRDHARFFGAPEAMRVSACDGHESAVSVEKSGA